MTIWQRIITSAGEPGERDSGIGQGVGNWRTGLRGQIEIHDSGIRTFAADGGENPLNIAIRPGYTKSVTSEDVFQIQADEWFIFDNQNARGKHDTITFEDFLESQPREGGRRSTKIMWRVLDPTLRRSRKNQAERAFSTGLHVDPAVRSG